ncbi:Protein of unknown function [Lactobacillus delbrueckii subsp. bulgaricus]|nr:Protein of unknown function [Lactobacillus delbrueckii subsp. bulgaricus]
MTKTLSQVM